MVQLYQKINSTLGAMPSYNKKNSGTKDSETKKLASFTIVTIIYNFIIIFLCITFLIIGAMRNDYLKNLSSLRQNVNILRDSYYNNILNVFMLYYIYAQNSTDTSFYSNFFPEYMEKIDATNYTTQFNWNLLW